MAIGRHVATVIGISLSLALSLSVSGSVPDLDVAGLFTGAKQRASFYAIMDYQACLQSASANLRRASGGNPSDEQIRRLGFDCPQELDDVAQKLVIRADWNDYDPYYRILKPSQRIEFIKKEFASDAWCEFRDCWITD